MTAKPGPEAELEDIIRAIQPLSAQLSPPGDLQGTALSIAHWLGRAARPAAIQHPRTALFAAHHGASSATERACAESRLDDLINGRDLINTLCELVDSDLRAYEMDFSTPTNSTPPAMTAESMNRAMAYGMMAVEPGIDIIIPGGFGGGSDASAQSLLDNPGFSQLAETGGFEIAAIAGSILAARLAGIPVLIDSIGGLAALAALCALNPYVADHCASCYSPTDSVRRYFRKNKTLQFLPPQPSGCVYIPIIKAISGLTAASAARAAA